MECDAMFDCCDGVLIKKNICKKTHTFKIAIFNVLLHLWL